MMNSNKIRHRRPKLDPADAPWANSMRKRVWDSYPRCQEPFFSGNKVEEPSIFRVPQYIRESDPESYDPSVVNLGPYDYQSYHCPSSLEVTQKHKWKCVLFLLSRHNDRHQAKVLLDECLAAMKELEGRARSSYAGEISLCSDKFSEMLLLDGCFVLHFLFKQLEKDEVEVIVVENNEMGLKGMEEFVPHKHDHYKTSNMVEEEEEGIVLLHCLEDIEASSMGGLWIWCLVKYDMLKLENQIPFFIIQALFDLLKTQGDDNVNLVKLALRFFSTLHPHRTAPSIPTGSQHVLHLLHLYHLSLLPSSNNRPPPLKCKPSSFSSSAIEWIPTATELRESGVEFKRKMDSESCLDITFSNGVIEIPNLHICKYSNSIFRNLLAFEQCFPVAPYITNYALFMDCILHGGMKDVRLLHLKGILVNRHGTDAEAAGFFNLLSKQVHHGYDDNYLGGVFEDIIRYTEFKWNRWRASLVREYFSSPWVIISVAAAIILLVLTVEQAFFAAYGYYSPPR